MGKRGPLPRSEEETRRLGNPGHRKLSPPRPPSDPPLTGVAIPGPNRPSSLSPGADEVWSSLIGSQEFLRLTVTDSATLAAYCEAVILHRSCLAHLSDPYGPDVLDTDLAHARRLRSVSAQARVLNDLGLKLGFSPSTRGRQAPVVPTKPRSKFGDLLEGYSLWDASRQLWATPTARGVIYTEEPLHARYAKDADV